MISRVGGYTKELWVTGAILIFGSWLIYNAFFDRTLGGDLLEKSYAHGHGRLLEAIAIDSRLGLAIGAPLLMSLCLIVWSALIGWVLTLLGSIVFRDV